MNARRSQVTCLQVSAGQGPKECAWVVAQVTQRLIQDAGRHGLRAEVVALQAYDRLLRNHSFAELFELQSVLIRVEGSDVDVFCAQWVGSVKWQGQSPYRPGHKRKNWFVGIQRVNAERDDQVPVLAASALRVDTCKAKGPGGQHVNKTNSAVRITHQPTGLQVRVDSERSQHRNKKAALQRLTRQLQTSYAEHTRVHTRDRWIQHYRVDRGNPVKTFVGPHFTEVKAPY